MGSVTLSTGTPAELVTRSDGGLPTFGLVLWPDIWGLRPLFVEHSERLVRDHGWAVCVIEPFPGDELLDGPARQARMATMDDADKLADVSAALDLLDGVCAPRSERGVLGFCMGGMYAMKSMAEPRLARCAAFYGMVRVPATWRGAGQADALDVVASAPPGSVLGIFGTEDPWCPPDEVDELEQAGAIVVRYPGADHGWAQDPDRENYRHDDAVDAWRRAESFLCGDLSGSGSRDRDA